MLSRILVVARRSMRDDAQRMKGLLERDHLELSVKLLDLHGPQLCERYPRALEDAFHRHHAPETRLGVVSTHGLRIEQLELMDESQVQERVEMARALQHVLLVAQDSLSEFNTFVCALLGHDHVNAERNPLRPDAYVAALQTLMSEMNVPALVRMAWMQHMSSSLGDALGAAYLEWSAQLQGQGVQPAAFTVVRVPDVAKPRRAARDGGERMIWSPQHRQTVLTLGRLRRLMAGEMDTASSDPKVAFARQFSRQFETEQESQTSFESTVPAAFEALQEMQQVDQVVQRMAQRPGAVEGQGELPVSGQSVREQIMGRAQGLGQSLSLEVVALMIDNLVHDTRLLEPIRDIIERLEPALLRLVLVDARFFVDQKHPARRLLQEIAQRGLAFGSVDDPQFNAFLVSLQRFVTPLAGLHIDNAEPFDLALKSLISLWDEADARTDIPSQMDSAMAALEYAEERNLLADKLVSGMRTIPEFQQVPASVVDFLLGPWSQVMACAQLNDRSGADDPGEYKALVNYLLWSAQPELTQKNVGKLTKMVPRLLSGLREGLRLIDYPSTKTSVFFDMLMKLHQQAFQTAPVLPMPSGRAGLVASLRDDHDHWVAPAEVKASGFMALPEEEAVEQHAEHAGVAGVVAESVDTGLATMAVGTWVELQVNAVWVRTQLSWVSPQRTMYLFTSGQGKTQSMTQRMLERLLKLGTLRVLSEQPMVDGALNAVVQTAMLNSLDLRTE